jgi:PPP family 3-phenylpropionic acid transporter
VAQFGAAAAIWLVVAGGVLTTAAAHALARPVGLGRLKAATSPPRLRAADAAGLLASRKFLLLLLATGAVQAAHAVFYTFGTLHWQQQGLSPLWSGTLWAIAVVFEVALFAGSRVVLRQVTPIGLIGAGAAAAVLRWLAMGFDPPLWALAALQLLHALTFAAAHVGAIHQMARTVPESQGGTAQALYASVTGGIAMGGAMLLAGPLYAAHGGRAYWAMALIAAVGLAAAVALGKASAAERGAQPHS